MVGPGCHADHPAPILVEPDRTLADDRPGKEPIEPFHAKRAGDPDPGFESVGPPILARVECKPEFGVTDDRLGFKPDPSPADHDSSRAVGPSAADHPVGIGHEDQPEQIFVGGFALVAVIG